MIDIENEVFTRVAKVLREKFEGVKVYGDEGSRIIATFPAVTLVETDNAAYERTMTSDLAENHVELLYTANVYSNKTSGKKAECKAIMAEINEVLTGLGFVRTSCQPVANLQDGTIYRMTARFTAVVSKTQRINRG